MNSFIGGQFGAGNNLTSNAAQQSMQAAPTDTTAIVEFAKTNWMVLLAFLVFGLVLGVLFQRRQASKSEKKDNSE